MQATAEKKAAPGWLKAFSALRHRQYRWYWFSGLGMTASQGIQQLAMAWLVLDLTDSVGQLGLVIFMQGVPMAVASLFGGVLADRYNRKSLLLIAQTVTMTNLTLLAVLTTLDVVQIWQVYLSSIGLGLMQALTMPARNALIRSLVDDADMLNAVALNALQMHSSRIIWPSLAGGLITLAGVGVTLGLSAACSLTGILFLAQMRGIKDDVESSSKAPSPMRQLAEGVRFAFSDPVVSTMMKISVSCGLFGLAYMNLAPGFAREELDLSASGTGFFIMAMGIGAIIGSSLLLFFPVRDGRQMYIVLMFAFALNIVAQAANPWLPGAFLIMGCFGLSSSALVVAGQTFLQVNVPPNMLGRMVGMWSLVGGLAFITALPIGIIGDEIGLRWALSGAAVLLFTSTLWFGVLSPGERMHRKQAARAAS